MNPQTIIGENGRKWYAGAKMSGLAIGFLGYLACLSSGVFIPIETMVIIKPFEAFVYFMQFMMVWASGQVIYDTTTRGIATYQAGQKDIKVADEGEKTNDPKV